MSAVQPIELVLEHDGHDWQAHGDGLFIRAATLPALDQALTRSLSARGTFPAGPLIIHMRFNCQALPGWTRQYMPHYFNRTVRLSPASNTETSLEPD